MHTIKTFVILALYSIFHKPKTNKMEVFNSINNGIASIVNAIEPVLAFITLNVIVSLVYGSPIWLLLIIEKLKSK